MDLDVSQPSQVSGHSVLRADLGGGRTLVVLSGIAVPEFQIDDDHTHRELCRVLLREPADVVEQSSVHVGLAGIGNDDSEWVFATDEASLDVNEAGELVLLTHLAVMGEPSRLHRFSYQVVLTTRLVRTEVTGTLRWATSMLRPATTDPAAIAGVFAIVANERSVTQSTGPFAFPVEHLTPIATGAVESVEIADDVCRARYRITDLPKARELKVVVTQHGLGNDITMEPAAPGADLATLTISNPARSGMDFVAMTFDAPA